jgi:hypothetical protein
MSHEPEERERERERFSSYGVTVSVPDISVGWMVQTKV